MATVYLVQDRRHGRPVALKLMNPELAATVAPRRFLREIQLAARLDHPHILPVYDSGEDAGRLWYVMPYVEGGSLRDRLRREVRLPVRDAVRIAREIADALEYAHGRDVIHRDIKPENILLAQGHARLADFGIARAAEATSEELTRIGTAVGTPKYMAPEQAGGEPVDFRSDLYSIACVLYEMLAGDAPYTGPSAHAIIVRSTLGPPPRVRAARPEVPEALDQIVLRALAKDPDERYQTAEEMDAELARVAEGLPVSAETAEAATQVLAGAGIVDTAPTMVTRSPAVRPPRPSAAPTPYRPPSRGYYYEEPPRQRPFWPWLVVLLLVLGAAGAVWLAWGKIQDQLNENKSFAVPNVVGIKEILAVHKLQDAGFSVPASAIKRVPDANVAETVVLSQDPQAGDKVPKGNLVELRVSSGAPLATVPDVRDKSLTDAVQILADRGLKSDPFEVPSSKPEGTVVAQEPAPGKKVPARSTVHINISKGAPQVAVPNVVGQLYEEALNQLQNAGFAVARSNVDSNEQKGVVIGQSPQANSIATKGARITLSVSKGPTAVEVPDVTGLDEATAQTQLEDKGFVVNVRDRTTDDPAEDGNVVEQRPAALSKVKPGATVTIYIGRLSEQTTTTTTTPTP
jgi:serine/threonine-protein kinase